MMTQYNLSGDYSYLSTGYYRSLDYELAGANIKPTTQEILDAYIVPIALKKAEQWGIRIPRYEIVNEEVSPPVLAYPINPFTSKCALIANPAETKTKIKALTMGGKYATLCQFLPENYEIAEFACIFGKTINELYHRIAEEVFAAFQLPLMKVRVIKNGEDIYFSAIESLMMKELSQQERALLEECGKWQG